MTLIPQKLIKTVNIPVTVDKGKIIYLYYGEPLPLKDVATGGSVVDVT
jgi:hypothetical protein